MCENEGGVQEINVQERDKNGERVKKDRVRDQGVGSKSQRERMCISEKN